MEDFEAQYQEELVRQEVKSNKKTILGFCWFFLAVFLTWIFTMLEIFIISKQITTWCLIVTILSMIPPAFIRWKVNLAKPWVKYLMLTLICVNCGIITSMLTIHAVLIYPIPLLFACQYRNKLTMWYTFLISSITMAISSFIGFYFGICDLNLLFESSATREYYLAHMNQGGLFIPLNEGIPYVISVYQLVPRIAILLIYTIMLQLSIKGNYDDAIRIVHLTHSKDTDSRTGLFNKNKLEEMADHYYLNAGNIAVAFFDLNNLKTVNDTYGHLQGDNLIKAFADILYEEQNFRCKAYRYGGDEFLLILEKAVLGEINQSIERINQKLAQTPPIKGIKVSAAVGVAYGPGGDIRTLIKQADEKMYSDKSKMKEKCQ